MADETPTARARRRTVLQSVGGLAAVAGLGAVGTAFATDDAAAADGPAWPSYMGTAANAGRVSGATGAPDGVRLAWTADPEPDRDARYGYPVLAENTLYVPGSRLWALSASDGSVEWSFRPHGDDAGRFRTCAVADGTVYAGSDSTDHGRAGLYALDADGGGVRWRFDDLPVSYVTATADAVLAAGDSDYEDDDSTDALYALDPATGAVRWRFGLGGENGMLQRTPPAPAVVDGTAYVKSSDGLVALDVASGRERWRVAHGFYAPNGSPPAVADGTVYAASATRFREGFFAVDAADGSLAWSVDAPVGTTAWSASVVGPDRVYVAHQADETTLTALSRADGSTAWAAEIEGVGPSAIGPGVLQVHGRALDPRDGSERWHYDGVEGDAARAIFGGETVYLCDRRIHALAPAASTDDGDRTTADPTETPEPTDRPTGEDPATDWPAPPADDPGRRRGECEI
ncbi:MAG: PQQ-binding-like beta-propeller repeat protein [Haloarculaceae archaeon]